MTQMVIARDTTGAVTYGRKQAAYSHRVVLQADTEHTHTVNSYDQEYLAIFSYAPGSSVFVGVNETATVPTTTADDSTAEGLPTAYDVKQGDVISFITSETDVWVTVAFYNLKG